MKIRNLKIRIARKIAACVIAASGFLSTSFVYSFEDIALGDPSFEAFVVPAIGYAYSDEYRPTSAWVDDPDGASGGYYAEDDGNSNWLYSAAYGSGFRATPRTGDQAMHGIGYYNGQEAADAVFEANKTYTFSVWAQGDNDADSSSSRVWMYIYDGAVPFSEANSLEFARYAPDTGDFVNRDVNWTDAESMAGWTQISISHTVLPGAPEIGHPIGVAFWVARDGAVDDATLTVTAPSVVAPDSVTTTRGNFVSGDVTSLADSDNVDYSIQRSTSDVQSRTEFVVKSFSPTATPTSFEFTLEGSVFARSNVVQTIELFDYVANDWVLVDSQNAARSPAPDSVVTVAATGDLSRFVQAGTMCVETRIHFQSDSPRQRFASNTDQAIWTIQ
jgi:hypothetical protein